MGAFRTGIERALWTHATGQGTEPSNAVAHAADDLERLFDHLNGTKYRTGKILLRDHEGDPVVAGFALAKAALSDPGSRERARLLKISGLEAPTFLIWINDGYLEWSGADAVDRTERNPGSGRGIDLDNGYSTHVGERVEIKSGGTGKVVGVQPHKGQPTGGRWRSVKVKTVDVELEDGRVVTMASSRVRPVGADDGW